MLPRRVAKLMGTESEWEGVIADSRGSMWVFGQDAAVADGRAGPDVWLHYGAGRLSWGMVRMPRSTFVSSAQAVGRGDVWAFGNPGGHTGRAYAWYYHRGTWTRTALPGRAGAVVSTAAVTPGDIWALESYDFDGNNEQAGRCCTTPAAGGSTSRCPPR